MGKCICPKCKSENIVPIMYGYPSCEAFEDAEKGNLKLGGCEILIDGFAMPDRFCKDCETEWCVDRLEADAIKKVRFKYWSNWGFYDPDSIVEAQWVFEIFDWILHTVMEEKSHMGDIGGGTIDKLVMDFLESMPEMKDKINESEDE